MNYEPSEVWNLPTYKSMHVLFVFRCQTLTARAERNHAYARVVVFGIREEGFS